MRHFYFGIPLIMFISFQGKSQDSLLISGQLSGYFNYAPENNLNMMFGGRYLPEANYAVKLKNKKQFDFEAAANIYGNVLFHPFDSSASDGGIKPYRVWLRYSGNKFEFRTGLQKINFGSAILLRPLQWFDDIDPRDPLQFSNGVYGVLGRYYFSNNANFWIWGLYGNENPRGFEVMKNSRNIPEFGGRLQLPVPKGEIALSFHHRTADSTGLGDLTSFDKIPENKFGLDGKWDVGIGLWFEASWVRKTREVGMLTNQFMVTLGADYTFGIGNGLNVSLEHLFMGMDERSFEFANKFHISAFMVTYPVGSFDRISGYVFCIWDTDDLSVMLNYEHSFSHFTGYIMAYYTPEIQRNVFTNRYMQSFTGPGIRLMAVFNH